MTKPRVAVGISGGVDSSVAALLLLESGYDVHGIFMKNWEESYEPGYCSAAEDLEDAEDVCHTLGIPLHKVNFSEAYRERVFDYFLTELRRGHTPNPDILCNSEIKFRALLDFAEELGVAHLATGHYARIEQHGNRRRLLKGLDPGKDQSYFLYRLNQRQLARALFPLGDLHKSRVRELAARAALVTSEKKDSTGICFIGERDIRSFLAHYLPREPGPMRTPEGECVGEHMGLMYYTIGQRQGLGIGGRRGESGDPWYVVDKDPAGNTLTVAQGANHPRLFHRRLRTRDSWWIEEHTARLPLNCQAKIRYRQPEQPCRIEAFGEEACAVVFDQAQRAITPGQSVVFYHGEVCLGGGIIEAAFD